MKKMLSRGCIYIVFILLAILVLCNKENFHVDEVFSYVLANTTGNLTRIEFEPGVAYEPASSPWLDCMTADADHRFDYKQVHYIQGLDCHPPFYYYLLHTICSLFPETFSIWYAGILNIVFALFILVIVRKILENLLGNGIKMQIISWGFALSAGLLHTVSFFRMYVLAMLLVTLVTYLFMRCVDRKMGKKDYVLIYAASVLCAHTHYYCVLYLVLLCVVFGVGLIVNKRKRELLDFCLAMCFAAVTAIYIFEPIFDQILGGHVRKLPTDNYSIFSLDEYVKRIKIFRNYINNQLFGGTLKYLLILGLLLVIFIVVRLQLRKEKPSVNKNRNWKWMLLILPSICYWLVVAQLAIYDEDRYMFPIYALSFIVVMTLLLEGLTKVLPPKAVLIMGIAGIGIVTINGFRTCGWQYLYKDNEPFLQEAAKYSDVDAILVYDAEWETHYSFYECLNYKSVTFIPRTEMEILAEAECIENDELLVMFRGDAGVIVPEVMAYCPNVDAYELLEKEGMKISTCYLSNSNRHR